MPGGEMIIGRTLTEKEHGVYDHVEFMLRKDEQKYLVQWLEENRTWLISGD
jgi:hypothetical protein